MEPVRLRLRLGLGGDVLTSQISLILKSHRPNHSCSPSPDPSLIPGKGSVRTKQTQRSLLRGGPRRDGLCAHVEHSCTDAAVRVCILVRDNMS